MNTVGIKFEIFDYWLNDWHGFMIENRMKTNIGSSQHDVRRYMWFSAYTYSWTQEYKTDAVYNSYENNIIRVLLGKINWIRKFQSITLDEQNRCQIAMFSEIFDKRS